MNPLDAMAGNLGALRRDVQASVPESAREVARQFESLFAQQLLAGMRNTAKVAGSGVSDAGAFQSLFDQQMAGLMTRGRGLGLAEQLVRQWQQQGVVPEVDTAGQLRPTTTLPTAVATPPVVPVSVPKATASDRITAFVERLLPLAREAARTLGVAPQAILAQAALETGFGRHQPGGNSHNLFGIKAGGRWQGAAVTATTTEVRDGTARAETARFRAYADEAEGVRDYVRLLQHPRYTAAREAGTDVARFAQALQSAGYATDPRYAEKLTRLAAHPAIAGVTAHD